jgi:hypothetical protein
MNIIKHRKYVIEFDVWEATEKLAQTEVDEIMQYLIRHGSHLGHLKFRLESEERTNG